MPKILCFMIISQLCSNGWWFCATQQESIGETPVILIPVIATVVLVMSFVYWLIVNWDKN